MFLPTFNNRVKSLFLKSIVNDFLAKNFVFRVCSWEIFLDLVVTWELVEPLWPNILVLYLEQECFDLLLPPLIRFLIDVLQELLVINESHRCFWPTLGLLAAQQWLSLGARNGSNQRHQISAWLWRDFAEIVATVLEAENKITAWYQERVFLFELSEDSQKVNIFVRDQPCLQVVKNFQLVLLLDLIPLVVIVTEIWPELIKVLWLWLSLLHCFLFRSKWVLDLRNCKLQMHLDYFFPLRQRLVYLFESISVLAVVKFRHLGQL